MMRTSQPGLDLQIKNIKKINFTAKRQILLSESGDIQSETAIAAAEKLVIACRENARFLKRHLAKYTDFVEITPLIENVLYLAYTLKVKDSAPFDTAALRRHLAAAGIETGKYFSFYNDPENHYFGKAANRIKSDSDKNDPAICLPCHQHLSIKDLQIIIHHFDRFFEKYENKGKDCA